MIQMPRPTIMTTEHIIILISTLLVLAVVFAVFFYIKYRKAKRMSCSESEQRLKRDLRSVNNELERYRTLYENYQKSEQVKKDNAHNERKTATYRRILSEAESVMVERKQIEEEKLEIQNRNRKLWDMSLSIQKEKERIAILKKDIEQKHLSVTDSIRYARYIQLAVLPSIDVLGQWFDDYFIFWRPLEIVSGDFYWMKKTGDIVVFTIADCTGHGVPGAFMSLLGITFLNDICSNMDDNTMPSDILEALRADIITAMGRNLDGRQMDDGMDIALCTLNLKTKKIYYAGANNPMYLVRNGNLVNYKPVRNPIGKYPFIQPFETKEVEFQKGDWIYMFSDGFADQFGEQSGRKLMASKFRDMISSLSVNNSDGKSQEVFLGEFLDNWKGNYLQMDDILVGGYKIGDL